MVSPFLKLFGRSPFKPLHEHMETVCQCVKSLIPFFDAVLANNWDEAIQCHEKINALEHKADNLKRNLRLHLPKDLFMPVARTDLLELLSYQDYLANAAKDIAGLVIGRKMVIPEGLHTAYRELLHVSLDSVKQAYKAIRELNDLLEAGFSGKEKTIIREMLDRLHDLEHQTDEKQLRCYQTLTQLETELPPIPVMFLYKLIDWTGSLADLAEKVGDRLQICIAR